MINIETSRPGKAIFIACCISVVGFLAQWLTWEFGSTFEEMEDFTIWERVQGIEIVFFGWFAARYLWIGAFKEHGELSIIRHALPLLVSFAFVTYSIMWLVLFIVE
jgi:hypothetical protein